MPLDIFYEITGEIFSNCSEKNLLQSSVIFCFKYFCLVGLTAGIELESFSQQFDWNIFALVLTFWIFLPFSSLHCSENKIRVVVFPNINVSVDLCVCDHSLGVDRLANRPIRNAKTLVLGSDLQDETKFESPVDYFILYLSQPHCWAGTVGTWEGGRERGRYGPRVSYCSNR